MNYPYFNNMRNNQMYGYPYNFQSNIPTMPQVVDNGLNQVNNYDFFGAFVKSYDEVKNYPFNCDKPLFLLDTANDKAYVKQMDNKGNPVITGFNITPLKEESITKVSDVSETDTELKKEMKEIREKMKELESLVNENATKTSKSAKGEK